MLIVAALCAAAPDEGGPPARRLDESFFERAAPFLRNPAEATASTHTEITARPSVFGSSVPNDAELARLRSDWAAAIGTTRKDEHVHRQAIVALQHARWRVVATALDQPQQERAKDAVEAAIRRLMHTLQTREEAIAAESRARKVVLARRQSLAAAATATESNMMAIPTDPSSAANAMAFEVVLPADSDQVETAAVVATAQARVSKAQAQAAAERSMGAAEEAREVGTDAEYRRQAEMEEAQALEASIRLEAKARLRGDEAAEALRRAIDFQQDILKIVDAEPAQPRSPSGLSVGSKAAVGGRFGKKGAEPSKKPGGKRRRKHRRLHRQCASDVKMHNDKTEGCLRAGTRWYYVPYVVEVLTDGQAKTKEHAALTIARLASSEAYRKSIFSAGAITPLVALLRTGTHNHPGDDKAQRAQKAHAAAAAALWNLAVSPACKLPIAKAGAIPPLVGLLTTGTPEARGFAVGALNNLAASRANQAAIGKAGAIAKIIEMLRTWVREADGGGPSTAHSQSSEECVSNAAGALGNLAADPANQKLIVAQGGLPPLVRLIEPGSRISASTKAYAAGALWNLAFRNADNKVSIASAGAIPPLISLLQSGSPDARSNAAAALWNLAVNLNNQVEIGNAGAIPHLAALLSVSSMPEARDHAAGAIGNLAASQDNLPRLRAANVVQKLIGLLSGDSEEGRSNAAGALGNLATTPEMRAAIGGAGAVVPLVAMYQSGASAPLSRDKAVGALRRLLVGNEANRQAILAAGFPAELLDRAVRVGFR